MSTRCNPTCVPILTKGGAAVCRTHRRYFGPCERQPVKKFSFNGKEFDRAYRLAKQKHRERQAI